VACVSRYEVHGRLEGGREWVKLGTFTGNNNNLTEHLNRLQNPVVMRFVRFVPVAWVGAKTCFQVGVFGTQPDNTTSRKKPKMLEQRPEVEASIVYIIEYPPEVGKKAFRAGYTRARVHEKRKAAQAKRKDIQHRMNDY
jgi:hypothetical protein